ncbi:hypothetical protein BU23DRAFT_525523 [Bimuria novae-zelandiae CBS 107.79]|uniref:Adipose-regulatory protein-domain-containing protein n=1 Tax=Bimuria novae-zelandiae CBS 107.79 TaxID=1447943 RepID=A0A6A5VQ16_9PLEO|nr:hypothetical protein BU23DRAFT_525523 [Bimuria novae-zelandiae CBS 107.79]
MDDAEDEEKHNAHRTLIPSVIDACLSPFRIAASPPLLRTYLRTILLLATSSILFAAAVVAYTSFYYAYIPVRGIDVPVYLQYDHSRSSLGNPEGSLMKLRHPYGVENVQGLVGRQKYDVDVLVTLPRCRKNLQAGNWMVRLDIRGPVTSGGGGGWEDASWGVEDGSLGEGTKEAEDGVQGKAQAEVLARSRRPALLTYRSWAAECVHRIVRLPLYILGWGTESETVRVRLMESVQFDRGWRNVPSSLRLELRARVPLAVYSVNVHFRARLEGLRWLMYTHRVSCAAVFIGVFWSVEMGVLLCTWVVFALCFGRGEDSSSSDEDATKVKSEHSTGGVQTEADEGLQTSLSDTDRTFPTLSSHQPLHYTSPSPGLKEERDTPALEDIPVKEEAEADDEEDDFLLEETMQNVAVGGMTDSGLGTSMESGVERRGLSRRKSGRGR